MPSTGCDATSATTAPQAGTSGERTVSIDGVERSYLVSDPGAAPSVPAPVIVLLHGMGETAAGIGRTSDLPDRAAATGTIVVTPQAVGSPTIWQPTAQGPDAAFVDQILDDLRATRCIDDARVYMAGFSVGAVLAAAYACARQDEIAAIVTITIEAPAGCTEPMPILSFHGTADPIIPYGNTDPDAPGGITGAEANMATWASTAGCQEIPATTEVGSNATRLEWSGCTGGAEVVLYRIDGGQHTWFGHDDAAGAEPGVDQVSATDEALGFFGRHHR